MKLKKEEMHHYRKTRKKYASLNAGDRAAEGCTFCKTLASAERILLENPTMSVLANRVSYDMFEGLPVTDHLMVIPKRHIETISDFTDAEKLDQMNIIGDYERRGYSIYARGVDSPNRTVKHQHTHMLKLANKKSRFIIYSAKPHLLVHK